jgi:hypothetical protein
MTPEDRELTEGAIDRGIEALHVLARDGLDAAQNVLHGSGS